MEDSGNIQSHPLQMTEHVTLKLQGFIYLGKKTIRKRVGLGRDPFTSNFIIFVVIILKSFFKVFGN